MMLGGYIYYGFSLLRDSVLCKCYNSVVPFCYPQTFSTLLKLESQKLNFLQTKSLDNMSTTRSQKRKNVQQEVNDNVSEGSISPINLEGPRSLVQEIGVPGPSRAKSPRIENSFLESLRSSLKEEITSEIKNLLVESQKEMLKLLRTETRENVRNNVDEDVDNETRSFYTPTKTVRINSTQNDDTDVSRNNAKMRKMPAWRLKHRTALVTLFEGYFFELRIVLDPLECDFSCFTSIFFRLSSPIFIKIVENS